jgi:hypothetical protein
MVWHCARDSFRKFRLSFLSDYAANSGIEGFRLAPAKVGVKMPEHFNTGGTGTLVD